MPTPALVPQPDPATSPTDVDHQRGTTNVDHRSVQSAFGEDDADGTPPAPSAQGDSATKWAQIAEEAEAKRAKANEEIDEEKQKRKRRRQTADEDMRDADFRDTVAGGVAGVAPAATRGEAAGGAGGAPATATRGAAA